MKNAGLDDLFLSTCGLSPDKQDVSGRIERLIHVTDLVSGL